MCLVAVNMRAPITGIGPLLEEIAADLDTTPAALGALASVPLLVWGVVSPLMHGIGERFGIERTIAWSIVLLMIGAIWRSLPGGAANLWLGTVLVGAALAVGNVLMPALVRRDFSTRIPLVMGVYSGVLGGFGAIAAGIVAPVSAAAPGGTALGWRTALLLTVIVAPVTLVVWVVTVRGGGATATGPAAQGSAVPGSAAQDSAQHGSEPPTPAPQDAAPRSTLVRGTIGRRIWFDPVAWSVAFYMGIQSLMFYVLSTWVAPIQSSFGADAVDAGFNVMIYQLAGIAGSVSLPLLYRGPLRRWLAAIVALLIGTAFAAFVLLPGPGWPWLAISGFGTGAALGLSLMFMAIRAREQETASALSGMAQSVGYIVAAAGPIVFGYLHEWTRGWGAPVALMAVACAVHVCFGIAVGRSRSVFEQR